MKENPIQRRGRRTIAQAMAEFGLALPILLLVVYGVIETGRLVLIYASVVTAARNAARYGSAAGQYATNQYYYNDCAGIQAAADRVAFLEKFKNITISYDEGPGGNSLGSCPMNVLGHPVNGDRINVTVSADYRPIVPLVPFGPFTITSTGNRTLVIGVPIGVDVPPVILTPGATGAIAILKDASPSVYHNVGEVITYTYTLKNQSTDPALGIVVHDNKAASNNCGALSPLAAGANATCTATYTITATDISNGTLTNIASFVATVGGIQYSAFTSLTINFAASPHITLTKSGAAPPYIPVGALVQYQFEIVNDGNVDLTGPYTITDALIGSNWSCPSDTLPVGGKVTCTGTYALKQQDINNGIINNTATASAKYHSAQTVTSDPASATVYVPPLFLQVSPSRSTVDQVGQVVTLHYTLTNRTNKSTSGITVSDTNSLITGTCSIPTLAAGAQASCDRTYTVRQADLDQTSLTPQITDTASATGTNNGKPVTSNRVDIAITVVQTKTLLLTKTAATSWPQASDAPAVPGPYVTYSYKLKNTGNVTLSGPYAVTDNKVTVSCAGISGSLAPGAEQPCTDATYNLTQADLDNGSIINTASGTAKFGTQTITSPQVSVTVITYHAARLKLTIGVNPPYWQTTATLLTYTYTLRNTGGVPLTAPYTGSNLGKVDGYSCTSAVSPLPIGGTTTCTGHYTTNPNDNSSATITTTAQFSALNGAAQVSSDKISLDIPKFVCNTTNLRPVTPPPLPTGLDVTWTIANNTGLPVHISAMYVQWNASPPNLIQIFLNSISIYNYASSSYAGFPVPTSTQPWTLPTGQDSALEYRFTATASSIRIVITFQESDCPLLDSSASYQ